MRMNGAVRMKMIWPSLSRDLLGESWTQVSNLAQLDFLSTSIGMSLNTITAGIEQLMARESRII